MGTFISWSGPECKEIAHVVKEFVSDVLGVDDVFMSDSDIAAGARSLNIIEEALDNARTALVLVTAESQRRPWLNFEAGAISAKLGKPRVVPILLNLGPSDLIQPLGQFQAIEYNDEGKMRDLLAGLNLIRPGGPVRAKTIDIAFESRWEDFVASVDLEVAKLASPAGGPELNEAEKLDEVLLTLRQLLNGSRVQPRSSPLNAPPRRSRGASEYRAAAIQAKIETLVPDLQALGFFDDGRRITFRLRTDAELSPGARNELVRLARHYAVDIEVEAGPSLHRLRGSTELEDVTDGD